ncbi:MAG: Gfo/Idh/MocA family oxidoreductase, partial [Gemmataceae bacterium]|nr:Gfo/Idh/MocA family oxidoreductase [Gemmataceae bacterium]
RVNVALIGCGGRGMAVARLMRQVPDVAFVAVCDVYERNAGRARDWAGDGCQIYRDFRRVLDRKDVDAVLVATPDHWHAIPTVLACRAGKDVYVEKPLAHNIREGRAMIDAARRNKRIVQTGTQHRSAPHYREAERIVQSRELGRVHFVRVWNYTNTFPAGIGKMANTDPPEGLDWDFYLGPAPRTPFNRGRFLGTFRWFWDYAGGFITDWGTHRFDSVHQVMGVDTPVTVSACGSRYASNDGTDTPDVMQVTYEYPGFVLSYESCRLNGHGVGGRTAGRRYYRARGDDDRPHGEAFYGTNGTLFSDRIGFEIYPELEPGVPRPRMKRRDQVAQDTTDLHVRNFIDCVRSRQTPVADVEIGHRSTLVAHLGNIAYRTGRKLRWDAAKEQIVGDLEAARLLGRQARKPWDVI